MAEIIGTTVGVVGFLGQLFDGCVKAYSYFSAARNLDTDSQRLICKVRIEEMRLVVWGREWGVAEGRFEAHLGGTAAGTTSPGRGTISRGNPQLMALATQILEQLHGTVTDFAKLKERYGLDEEGAKSKTAAVREKGAPAPATTATTNGAGNRSWKRELGLRTKWVISDKDKFGSLLVDLKDFNDGLERLFPPSQVPSYQRAWTHELLESAQRNVGELSLLETASTGVYPQLTNSAGLKKLRINLDAAPQAAFRPTYALRVKREDLTLAEDPSSLSSSTAGGLHVPARRGKKGGSSAPASSCEDVSASEATTPPTTSATAKGALTRSHAHHSTAGDVLVEWVEYDREEVDERVAHLRRLDDLARVMHSASSRHPDLHGMDCLGYTDDSARSRYGLVYRAPAGSHSSLAELLGAGDMRTPDLDDRVALAATLAVAAWSLHSLDWLHKSLCSSNVLFFPSAAAAAAQRATSSDAMAPVLDAPRLTGFDASRPDLDTALSVVPRNPSIADLHRHPDSLRGLPYSKAYDVYSLGLLLLEIGLWKPLAHYHKSHYSPDRWRRRVVTPVLVPALASKCGKRYRDVVDDCINVDPHLSSKDAAKLMENVVARLEAIRL